MILLLNNNKNNNSKAGNRVLTVKLTAITVTRIMTNKPYGMWINAHMRTTPTIELNGVAKCGCVSECGFWGAKTRRGRHIQTVNI